MKFDRSKFTAKFVSEAREHVEYLSTAILGLEENPGDLDEMPAIKRAAHTLKGSARMLKFLSISKTAHKAEDLFIAIMEGKIKVSPALTDVLLRLVDFIKTAVETAAGGGEEPAPPEDLFALCDSAIEGKLREKHGGLKDDAGKCATQAVADKKAPPGGTEPADDMADAGADAAGKGRKASRKEHTAETSRDETIRVLVNELDAVVESVGEIRLDQQVNGRLVSDAADLARRISENSAYVDSGRDRRLMANQLDDLAKALARLKERQHSVRSSVDVLFEDCQRLRMVPLQELFERFRRPVRDLARTREKRVKLVIKGGEMRLDKQIADFLHAPMLHIVNNAVDHGIEEPGKRKRAGKPEQAHVTVSARGLAGAIEIVVEDDGAGIDTESLAAKAVERGVITSEQASSMTHYEKLQLAFHAGLSSASIITELSGRGVGMDVVRKVIEEDLKGAVVLSSQKDKGTKVILRLPMSLTSRRLFFILAASRVYALALASVDATVLRHTDELIDVAGRPALKWDNQFIPVVEAKALLGISSESRMQEGQRIILVLVSGAERLGLAVDDILREEEELIKPLPALLEGMSGIGGITFGRDGEPVPVLYPPDLLERARMLDTKTPQADAVADTEEAGRSCRVLVVDDSYNTREVQRHILEANGYTVVLASDGVDALERLASEDVDLMVTDIEMPRMDGFELVSRVRSDERYKRLPVVILTSRESEGDRARGIEVGANAYIVKRSFDEEKLTITLETLLS